MRTTMLTACAMLVAGLAVSAQTPQTPPQSSTPSTSAPRSTDAAGPMPVTGCLAAWDGKSMTGRADSASPSGSPGAAVSTTGTTYMLTNVHGSGSSSSSGAASSFLLTGDSSVNLSAHLNHKVQITGAVDKGAENSSATPSQTTPPSDAATASADSRAHDMGAMKPATLRVTSVTMVSATCP